MQLGAEVNTIFQVTVPLWGLLPVFYFSNNFAVALKTADAVTVEVLISSLLINILSGPNSRNTGWFASYKGCKERGQGGGAQSTPVLLLESSEYRLLWYHRFDTGPPAYKAASMVMEIKPEDAYRTWATHLNQLIKVSPPPSTTVQWLQTSAFLLTLAHIGAINTKLSHEILQDLQ